MAGAHPRPQRPLRASGPAVTAPCQSCGRSPALTVTFRSVVGLGLPFRLYTDKGRYCRACGTRTFQKVNGRTLLLGWWSVFGFFANLVVIAMNAREYRRMRGLGAPRRSAPVTPQTVRPVRHPELR